MQMPATCFKRRHLIALLLILTLAVAAHAQNSPDHPIQLPSNIPAKPAIQIIRSGPVRVSSGMAQSLLIKKVDPDYPPILDAEGTVALHVNVDTEGIVSKITVVSGPSVLLKSARNAVWQWKYKPIVLEGVPTPFETIVYVTFKRLP